MKKSEEILRMERDMNENPELLEKLKAEVRRIAEAGEAECDGEALLKAAAALGYTITLDEQDRAAAELEAVDDEELSKVAGGMHPTIDVPIDEWCMSDYDCFSSWHTNREDEEGHNEWCLTGWHCTVATLHSDTESKEVACFSNYLCAVVYHHRD